jgi:hypothetical protein
LPFEPIQISRDEGRSVDRVVAGVSRVRSCAWIVGWVVAVCLASAVSSRAETPAGKPEGSAAPQATATSSPQSKATSRCQEYIDVLSGKKKDDGVLADFKLRAVQERVLDVACCRAVATDSDEPCALVPEKKDECRLFRSTFHELRTNPTGRSYMFPDVADEACRAQTSSSVCDRLREATHSGDAEKCKGAGDQEAWCRAVITLDESVCAKAKEQKGCQKGIEASRMFAKGLKALAESGPPREQAFAKAALGDAEACTAFAEAAVGACTGVIVPAPTKTPVKPTAVPSPSRTITTRQ